MFGDEGGAANYLINFYSKVMPSQQVHSFMSKGIGVPSMIYSSTLSSDLNTAICNTLPGGLQTGVIGIGEVDTFHSVTPKKFPLGTTTRLSNPSSDKAYDRWGLLTVAQRILPGERVGNCFNKRITVASDHVTVVQGADGRHHYSGLQTCGSVWACPICAAKISARRRDELNKAIVTARLQRLNVHLLTLTIPHTKADTIDDLLHKLSVARRLFRNRKVWKRLSRRWGLVGYVRDLEVMHGQNGWHVHFHELLFCSDANPQSDQAEVLTAWQDACEAAGIARPNIHGVDIRNGDEADKYVSKWGMAEEITLTHSKDKARADASVTPWGLLAMADTDVEARTNFMLYYVAIKGRKQLVWSKGLRDLLDLGTEKTDEELAREEITGVPVMQIDMPTWKIVLANDARGNLLQVLNIHGIEGAVLFLALLHNPPPG